MYALIIRSDQTNPKAARFKNNGFPYYDLMSNIMPKAARGTYAFRASQQSRGAASNLPASSSKGKGRGRGKQRGKRGSRSRSRPFWLPTVRTTTTEQTLCFLHRRPPPSFREIPPLSQLALAVNINFLPWRMTARHHALAQAKKPLAPLRLKWRPRSQV